MSAITPRAGYDAIPLYAPTTGGASTGGASTGAAGETPCVADASDTVNLWGAPPDAVAALRAASA